MLRWVAGEGFELVVRGWMEMRVVGVGGQSGEVAVVTQLPTPSSSSLRPDGGSVEVETRRDSQLDATNLAGVGEEVSGNSGQQLAVGERESGGDVTVGVRGDGDGAAWERQGCYGTAGGRERMDGTAEMGMVHASYPWDDLQGNMVFPETGQWEFGAGNATFDNLIVEPDGFPGPSSLG